MTTQVSERPPAQQKARPGWALLRPWRRVLLVCHILSAGAWIGVDVIVAVLVLTGWFSHDAVVRGLAYRALAHFTVAPMLLAGIACLLTGLALGWGTKWGLLRYWWVGVKLLLNVVLCAVMVAVLAPGMPDVDRYGASLATAGMVDLRVAGLFFPPVVSLSALTFAVVLSVAKPWGRIRLRVLPGGGGQ